MNVKLSELTHFFDKQKEATKLADKYKYTLFGGSAGPGKSYWIRWYIIRQLINWYRKTGLQGIRAGLFCEDYPALKDRHVSKMQYEYPSWLGQLKDSNVDGLVFKLAPSFGNGIIALRNLDDPSKYLSSEFALIAIDELTKDEKHTFDMLRLRLRWTGIDNCKFIAATNPGGIGHVWVKKLWIDKEFDEGEKEADQFVYLRALPIDNPYLSESYKTALQSLPERLRKAYWEGDWNVFEGQFFSEFSESIHSIEPFKIPDTWKKIRCIDHGRAKPTACMWGAIDWDGNIYWYREYYKAGVDADINAQEIARLSIGETYGFTVLDSACFSKTGSGETIAEIYQRNGVTAEPSSKDRMAGWSLFHEFLRWGNNEQPKMKFFKTCVNAIKTIPTLIHDFPNKVEDIDTDGEDHCLIGETLIDTYRGQVMIKDLVGQCGMAWTYHGWKKFRSVRKTGKNKEVYKIILQDGRDIVGTGNHQVLTQRGWVQIKDIDINIDGIIQSKICTKLYQNRYKSLMVRGIICAENIFRKMVKDYILPFGNIILARFRRVITYITKMRIGVIIALIISKLCQKSCIYRYTCQRLKERNTREKQLKSQESQPINGMDQKRDGNGIVNMPKTKQKNGIIQFIYANGVEWNLRASHFRELNTVIPIVELKHFGSADVYNLTVPNEENFAINGGLIVHNCADAISYGLQYLHESKSPPEKDEIHKMLDKLKHKGSINPSNLNSFYGKN